MEHKVLVSKLSEALNMASIKDMNGAAFSKSTTDNSVFENYVSLPENMVCVNESLVLMMVLFLSTSVWLIWV